MDKNLTERFEIRISKEDHLLLKLLAVESGMKTPSNYIRMVIDTATRKYKDKILNGELTYENVEAILHDKLQYRKLFKK